MPGETIYTNSITDALVLFADKLGITAPELYEIYSQAHQSMALVQIAFILIWVIAISLTFIGVLVYSSKLKKQNKDQDPFLDAFVAVLCVGFLLGFVLFALYPPTIVYYCPEYSALQSLISEFKKVV